MPRLVVLLGNLDKFMQPDNTRERTNLQYGVCSAGSGQTSYQGIWNVVGFLIKELVVSDDRLEELQSDG